MSEEKSTVNNNDGTGNINTEQSKKNGKKPVKPLTRYILALAKLLSLSFCIIIIAISCVIIVIDMNPPSKQINEQVGDMAILRANHKVCVNAINKYQADNDGAAPKRGEELSTYLSEELGNWTNKVTENKDGSWSSIITWLADDDDSRTYIIFTYSDNSCTVVSTYARNKEVLTIAWDGVHESREIWISE